MPQNYIIEKISAKLLRITKYSNLLCLFALYLCLSNQSALGQTHFESGDGWGTAGWNNYTAMTEMPSGSGKYVIVLKNTATGNKYYRCSNGSGTNRYGPNANADVILNPSTSINTLTDWNSGYNKAYYTAVVNTNYSYVFKSNGATSKQLLVFEILGDPITVTGVTNPGATAGMACTITATLSGSLPTGQAIYIRYTNDNFATTAVTKLTGSGTSYSAAIPSAINTSGATVKYYVFTSGTSNVSADGSNSDFYTININNNSNTNYSYTVAASPTAPVLSATTTASGTTCSMTSTGGNVTSDGGATITERGIVFSTSSTPTTSNTKTIASGTTGSFVANINGLSASTLYYVRAYATNSIGTTYGTQMSFTTSAAPTLLSSDFYSDRVYFKNGTNADEKYYLQNNAVPLSGCTATRTDTAGAGTWDAKNLGSTNGGTTLKLGGFLVTKGIQNGNTPKMNYRIYLTSSDPGITSFTQVNMSYDGECTADGVDVNGSSQDKVWRNELSEISVPNSPGNYTIEIYYERAGDQLGNGGTVFINNCGSNYKATIDVIRVPGIFSDVIFFDNGTTITNHTAAGYDPCDSALTIESGKWNGKDLGSLDPGKTLKISGMVLTLDNGSPITDVDTYLNYRIYKSGATPPSFTAMSLTNSGGTICGDPNVSKFEQATLATLYTTTSSNGTYFIELYYTAKLSDATIITRGTSSVPYKASFSILAPTPVDERDPNDGNYNPTASNTSGMFESYMGVLVLDAADVPITGLNRVFDMDGALSSSNNSNFDFGTQDPGLDFKVGTETKVFTKGTHKMCGCSSWDYVYKSTDADPLDTDFPLPPPGALFESQINGKFIILNSSININTNEVFAITSGAGVNATGSTSDGTYNSALNTSTITKYKDYTDPTIGTVNTINKPVFPVLCPTCSGPYKVAIAMLAWIGTQGKCPGEVGFNSSDLIYHRDINKNKVNENRIVLNPNHNDAPSSGTGNASKNSLPGTSLFYISKVNIGATGGTKTWNGTTWSGGVPPTGKNDVSISGNYSTTSGSFTCNDMTVNDGIIVTIKNETYIEALNTVTTTGTAKIIVENKGNFVQRCDEKAPSAYIEHTKSTETKRNWDYEYWGSPVVQDITSTIPTVFDEAYYWDGGDGGEGWKTLTSGSVTIGKGFITRVSDIAPYNITPTQIPWTITGTATNGIYTTLIKNYSSWSGGNVYEDYLDYALLGNPYPCALDAKTFLSHPRNIGLGSTLYFWTAITPIAGIKYLSDDPWAYNYNPEDYAAWNYTGGIATADKALTDISGTDILKPTGKIASSQGFFVEVIDDGNAYFNNSMRLTSGNTQFFKQIPKGKKPFVEDKIFPIVPPGIQEGRLWLNVSNKGHFRQMLLGYVKGATNDYDKKYDGEVYSDSPVLLYTMIDNKDYTIQGRQLPFDQNETISIGFETEIDGEFYISIDEADGFFTHQKVYLKDNLLGIEQDLKQTAYKFSTEAGIFKDRFELKFTDKTLTTNELQTASEPVIVTAFKNQIKVNSTNEEISSILIYDITGKKLLSKNNINKNEITIEKPSNQNGVYLVKIKLADAQELTRKVIF
jgi:hypothetical protein